MSAGFFRCVKHRDGDSIRVTLKNIADLIAHCCGKQPTCKNLKYLVMVLRKQNYQQSVANSKIE